MISSPRSLTNIKTQAFELEFSNDNSVGHTDIAPFPPMPAVPKLDDYLKVARVSYANLPRHSTDDEVTKGFPPSQSRKTPFNDPSHSIPLYDQDPSILKTLPGNMEVFKGNNDPNMSNVWAVSCARQECRTNTRKRGELLKGAKGVCLHARCSHYQAWKPIFEGKSEQTKLFSSNPDWCHWYQLTKAEHEEWYDTGKVPEIAMPRGVATPFMPSKPPTHRFSDD